MTGCSWEHATSWTTESAIFKKVWAVDITGEHRAIILSLLCRQIIGHCYLLSQNRSSAKKVLGWAGLGWAGWAGLPPDTYNLVIKSPVMAAAGGGGQNTRHQGRGRVAIYQKMTEDALYGLA